MPLSSAKVLTLSANACPNDRPRAKAPKDPRFIQESFDIDVASTI
jgi:hypothetical protein